MEKEYYGLYKELSKWRFNEILDIKKEDLSDYEFIVLKTNDYNVPPSERYNAINHKYFLQVLDLELNRKTITAHNWSLVSKMATNSAFSPSSLSVSFVDLFGEELSLRVDFNQINSMSSVFELFEKLEKFHDVSHYKVTRENERLKKQLQRARNINEGLTQKNEEYLEQIETLKKKLKKIKGIIKNNN
jgi:hypothetical protein